MEKEIRSLEYSIRDLAEAGPDYLAKRGGANVNGDSHPLAEDFANQEVTLAEMAAKIGVTELAKNGRTARNNLQALSAGLSSDDFGGVLENTFRRLLFNAYDIEADHRRIALETPVRDFRPQHFPRVDLDLDLSRLGELAEKRHSVSVSTDSGETATVDTYGARLGVSRHTVINDDVGLLAGVMNRLGSLAGRLEAESVFSVLEDNPTLSDGSAMFANDNLLTSAEFSKSSLGEAFAALRRQTDATGKATGNPPAYVVVPPEKEVEALETVASLSNDTPPVEVITSHYIDASRWYVTARPERAPVVALLRLADSQGRAVDVFRSRPRDMDFDGTFFDVSLDFGAKAIGRVGAVRAEA